MLFANGHIGNILAMIKCRFQNYFFKLTQLTVADAQAFYSVHAARPFYGELVEFMSRGAIVAAILEKTTLLKILEHLLVLLIQLMPLKVQYVKHMLLLLEKMQFTVLTVMKMQLSKVLSFCRKRAV
jgi:hypothetical protein